MTVTRDPEITKWSLFHGRANMEPNVGDAVSLQAVALPYSMLLTASGKRTEGEGRSCFLLWGKFSRSRGPCFCSFPLDWLLVIWLHLAAEKRGVIFGWA